VRRSRMRTYICLLTFLVAAVQLSVQDLQCVGCTSDDGNNPGCEKEMNITNDTPDNFLVPCKEEFTHCYVQYIINEGLPPSWSRGCCAMSNNDQRCLASEHEMDPTGLWEKWTRTCTRDFCNTMDPSAGWDNGGGGGGGGDIIVVNGKGSGASALAGFLFGVLACVTTIAVLQY